MFPQFGATAETLSKASTLVFRIGTDAHLYDDPEDVNIAPLLDSKFDSEKCEALKRLLALIAQGFDVSNFFPQVVKNVASPSLEVKKLVYLYLLHYAEKRPNEALLSINCFQKDLGDTNPLVRAWALRTMAGIRLHVIASLVIAAVGKCARDASVYVRKCAANALPKLHDLRIEENAPTIEEIVGILLSDHSPGVVGAAAAAFASICPNNFSLIGKNYKRLCEILPDVEEWGQIILIGILLRYVIARHGLVKESIMCFLHSAEGSDSAKDESDSNFMAAQQSGGRDGIYHSELAYIVSRSYIEGPDEYFSRSSYLNGNTSEVEHFKYTSGRSNDDVKILLQCTQPLLWSHNSSVVMAAAGVHWIMESKDNVKRIVKPLLFVLRSSSASSYVVLCNIQVFAKAMPSLFAPYFEDFFINSSDTYQIRALKLDILSLIATDSSMSSILREFQDYIRDPDRRFAADAVSALGLCAQRLPLMAETCLDGLMVLTKLVSLSSDSGAMAEEAGVLSQIILSIISIVKQDPSSHEQVIAQLFRSLDTIKVPEARAMITWMLGEYNSLGERIPKMLTTLLKYLAWCFKSEALEVKRQILTTTVKVLLCAKKEDYWTFRKILTYVLDMAECDTNYDVRDRARFLRKLLESNTQSWGLELEINHEPNNMQHVLFEQIYLFKLKAVSNEPSNCRFYLPGSLSHIVLHSAPGYEPLPKPRCWVPHNISNFGHDTNAPREEASDNNSSYSDGSGSFNEESASDYSSENSNTGSSGRSDSYENESRSEANENTDPLIQISDKDENGAQTVESGFDGIRELMANRSLESWLDEGSGSSNANKSKVNHVHHSSARINIRDLGGRVKPKTFTLLDPTNGSGLKVDYSFSSEVSTISPLLLCVDVSFKNCSKESISKVVLVGEESGSRQDFSDQQTAGSESSSTSCNEVPSFVPMEEISSLECGQTAKRIIQVHFHHHLLPLKLAVCCDGKKIPVKLRPDIGYFVRPLPMDVEAFMNKQSRLPGMFEYTRSCTFTDHVEETKKDGNGISLMKDKFLIICESLAVKILSNVNLFLVTVDMPVHTNLDDASGLQLRFSCEILSNYIPCLVTVTLEGKCSEPLKTMVKINCEETVFGLNLLNRMVNFLAEASGALS